MPNAVAEPIPVEFTPTRNNSRGIQNNIARLERAVDIGRGAICFVGQRHCRSTDDKDLRGCADALQLGVQVAEKVAHVVGGELFPGHAQMPSRLPTG